MIKTFSEFPTMDNESGTCEEMTFMPLVIATMLPHVLPRNSESALTDIRTSFCASTSACNGEGCSSSLAMEAGMLLLVGPP